MEMRDERRSALKTLALAIVGASSLVVAQAASAQTENQTFDTAESAAAGGWVSSGSEPNYGWRASNNTEQTPGGEAGGTFIRTNVRSHYADTTLGGTLDLSQVITARGELDVRNTLNGNNEFTIGHFNTSATGQQNVIGLMILEESSTSFRYQPIIRSATGAESTPFSRLSVPNASAAEFDYTWNPTTSTLTVRILDVNGNPLAVNGTNVMDLSSNPTLSLNAFGLTNGFNSDVVLTQKLDTFIDDVTYTSLIPEPASLGLLAGAGLLLRRRRA